MFAVRTWIFRAIPLMMMGLLVALFAGCGDEENSPSGPTVDSSAPALLWPANAQYVDLNELAESGNSFVLDWDQVADAVAYHIQLSPDNGFGAITLLEDMEITSFVDVDDVDGDGNTTEIILFDETEVQVNKLLVGNTYYWRAATVWDDGSETGWGEVFTFTPTAEQNRVPEANVLEGEYFSSLTLLSGNEYLLRGGVFIGSDNPGADEITLTIQPGVTIYGESATEGMLVIRRSGKINAVGTANDPIVFTSDKPSGSRGRGDWGGVIINGEATLNTGSEAYGEGDTGPYGGANDSDNSGTMRYCRIEFAGREISPDNELNGLALQGVGSGTTIEYVQVHMNKDDGIEFFGGTVNARYIYVSGCADDQFDWTDGWRGNGQYWVCQQYADDADQGIEADNNGDNNSATPMAEPMLANLTLLGAASGSGESDIGMLIREGTGAHILNAIVMNFGDVGLDIDQDATYSNIANGSLVIDYCLFYNNEQDGSGSDWSNDDDNLDEEDFITRVMDHNIFGTDPMLVAATNIAAPDFTLQAGSAAITSGGNANSLLGSWFDATNFIGAFDPALTPWTEGWTTADQN